MSDWDPNDLVVGVEGHGPVYPPTPEPEPEPSLAVEVATLVQGYIDDKIGELRYEMGENFRLHADHIMDINRRHQLLQSTVGGLRDAMIDADQRIASASNLPEHVYKNFIKSEAERLRLVKPVRVQREDEG